MKAIPAPAAATVGMGLVFGLLFIPMVQGFGILLPPPLPVRLTIWLCLAVYAALLSRWSAASGLRALFPLGLMGLLQFGVGAPAVFWGLAGLTLSWLRSGVFFPDRPGKVLTREIIFCGLGGILAAGFHPRSPAAWAMAVWLFMLVQALFFVLFPVDRTQARPPRKADPFEAARRAAERILDGGR